MNIIKAGYGYRETSSFSVNRPWGSGDYVLIVLRSASYFVLDGKHQIVPENSVIIYQKGTPQHYGSIDDQFVNDWIHFVPSKSDLNRIEEIGIPFDTILPLYDTAPLSLLIKNLIYENISKNKNKERSIRLYFDMILYKISDLLSVPISTDKDFFQALSSLRNKIYLNPSREWKIEEICEKMNFSRSYIQHSYKNYFDESIQDSITNSRIEHAKHLLSSTDDKVSEIATLCGYHSDVHFIRIFKSKLGLTPIAYRKASPTFTHGDSYEE